MADHVPVRTCIGCRARAPRDQLVRHVVERGADGRARVVRDEATGRPGRGAWLHDDASCQLAAQRRRALGRALRVNGDWVRIPVAEFQEHDGAGHVTKPGTTEEAVGTE